MDVRMNFFAEVAEGKQIAGHVQYRCDQSGGEAQPVFCQKHQPDDASLCDIYPLMNIVNAEGIDGRAGHDEKHMLYRQSSVIFLKNFVIVVFIWLTPLSDVIIKDIVTIRSRRFL